MEKPSLRKAFDQKDACHHNQKGMAPDGEEVCMSCGMVLGEHQQPTTVANNNPNKLTLYVARKLGSNSVTNLPNLSNPSHALELVNRHKDKKDVNRFLSNFSNVCSKLGLSQVATDHAWRLFEKLFKELEDVTCIYHAELVCYAIASGLAISDRPIDEKAISEKVSFVFGSKIIRDMYYIRRAVETRADVPMDYRPKLVLSARWVRGGYGP